ncbi:LuxR family transcriptional regulator [Amycolatopsis sp. NPDC023774]|uniref:helix-turn-helix transcriptional regulator n=1 Tax=Amycolatopsis sp. NPDC023774 TaxID=3155015 RepID=UPI0033E147C3
MAVVNGEAAERAFAGQAWREVYTRLTGGRAALTADDLVRLSTAAYLLGHDDESFESRERAYLEYVRGACPAEAARCAFFLALPLLLRGEPARANGWLARARRLLDEHGLDCVERGYLLVPVGLQRIQGGDTRGAHDAFTSAVDFASRFGDTDLLALGRHAQGRALIKLHRTAEGLALLDEAMVSVTSGEVSPIPAGVVYCSAIEGCHEVFDVIRAQEWTASLSAWCAAQPDLVLFRGQCLVHRSQVLQALGAWPEALAEARRAGERLSGPRRQPALGMALYQEAELRRLRGELAAADDGYRKAGEYGHPTQPGCALLRLAQGRTAAAVSAIGHAVVEAADDHLVRARMLAAQVEIVLAAGEPGAARGAAGELTAIAAEIGMPLLRATAAHARGSVLLAEGDPSAALGELRAACEGWAELDAPYDGARTRLLIGRARQLTGDDDAAEVDFATAREVLHRLGAGISTPPAPPTSQTSLTERELQVLALVAEGLSNRQIAARLVISEHTVRRHLQNVFAKLGVPSRAAAATHAVQHHLI